MKNPWIVIGVIVAILIGGSVWYSGKVSEKNNEGVVVQNHFKGGENATVVLTEYSDFECPACAQFQPIVNQIVSQYGDSIKFEYKHYPLIQIHKYANMAAVATEAAGQQGKFFEFADKLFENQATWAKSANPMTFFNQYANELGLDMEKFNRHQRSSILQDKVKSEMMEARAKGLTGTPSFYLNGTKMEIVSFEDFASQIEAAVRPAVDFSLPGEALKVVPLLDSESTTTATSSVAQ